MERKFAMMVDSIGELFCVEFNTETGLYHFEADESYAGYNEEEIEAAGGYLL